MTIAYGISPRQIKAIHALVGRLGWDDALYRAMLRERYRVTTCKALSHARAAMLIDELKAKVGQGAASSATTHTGPARPVQARKAHTWASPPPPPSPLGGGGTGRGGTISPKQQDYLNGLFAGLGWGYERRAGFCQKAIGRRWPQSNREVSAVLRTLKPIAERYRDRGPYDRAQYRENECP